MNATTSRRSHSTSEIPALGRSTAERRWRHPLRRPCRPPDWHPSGRPAVSISATGRGFHQSRIRRSIPRPPRRGAVAAKIKLKRASLYVFRWNYFPVYIFTHFPERFPHCNVFEKAGGNRWGFRWRTVGTSCVRSLRFSSLPKRPPIPALRSRWWKRRPASRIGLTKCQRPILDLERRTLSQVLDFWN
jgi:hypothetical protein